MKETNPKKLNLAALLEEDDAPTNPRICFEPECGNFALLGDEYCARHRDKRPPDVSGLGEDAEAKAILKAQSLCTRCRLRPFVYGSAKDGICAECYQKTCATKRAVAAPNNGAANLTPKQRQIMDRQRRRNKPQEICEENWGGMCKGGCGKTVQGEFYCSDCRKSAAEKNFKLEPGEVELYRGSVGKKEDRIVKQVVAIDATSIKAEPMTWLWKDRIPDGAITWIVGQPGNAKSLLTIEVVACATTGKQWPDGTPNTMGAVKVLMFCGEDDLAKTVVPRLMAAGADLTKVRFLDRRSFRGTVGDSKVPGRSIDLDQDMETLLGMLKANPDVKLLVADPITGIFGSKKIGKDEEVNPILEELVDLCKVTGLTFLGVSHTPKRTTNSSIEKISGGSSVAGKCRAAFMLSGDPDSDDKHDHVMTLIKGNLTGNQSGMKYRTVAAEVEADGVTIPIVKISWGETTDMIADDVLAAQNSKKDERDRQQDKCEAFLRTFLAKGPQRSPEVYDAAKQLGFGDTTVRRALKKIGGDHVDRRNHGSGYWMTLTSNDEFVEPKATEEPTMVLADAEAL
jgi:putative DNA primase/helicase